MQGCLNNNFSHSNQITGKNTKRHFYIIFSERKQLTRLPIILIYFDTSWFWLGTRDLQPTKNATDMLKLTYFPNRTELTSRGFKRRDFFSFFSTLPYSEILFQSTHSALVTVHGTANNNKRIFRLQIHITEASLGISIMRTVCVGGRLWRGWGVEHRRWTHRLLMQSKNHNILKYIIPKVPGQCFMFESD